MRKTEKFGYEGIVIRNKNSDYAFEKESVYVCKVKPIQTFELEIIGVIPGEGKRKNKLRAFICNYKGKKVRVGGGLNEKQREDFLKEPPKWIEVKAKGETSAGLLREPIFIRARDDI